MFSGTLKNNDICGITFGILQEISHLLLQFFCENFIPSSPCVYSFFWGGGGVNTYLFTANGMAPVGSI
jgi:hypothetical protein